MSKEVKRYKLTTLSCMVGIFVQAIITNITAILFIPLMNLYGFSYIHLGILVGINFSAQVVADIILSRIIDKCGFKKLVLPATILAFCGLILFALTPLVFKNIFSGIVISTIIFSASSGFLEVLLSPIINAIPNDDKGPAMSLMHSFYAWGQVTTIIITTFFVFFVGGSHWQIIVLIWSIVPLVNFFMFLKSPFPGMMPEEHRQNMKDLIFKPFYLFALAAIFFGASTEVVMNQWSSTFTEKALHLPKLTGDLLGMCSFAVMLGIGRMLYGIYGSKININKVLVNGAIIATICYVLVAISPVNAINLIACALCGFSASLLWPGTLVITADKYPFAGAWMFAILAAAGDVGAAFGPWVTGVVVDNFKNNSIVASLAKVLQVTNEQASIRIGILIAAIFPFFTFICHFILMNMQKKQDV